MEDQVTIWRDKEKNLPETDPFDRQLTIGMGCFLEQMAIAASETGHTVAFDLFPQGENGPVAIARFSATETADSIDRIDRLDRLAAHMQARRSCKEPFEEKIPQVTPELAALADILIDPSQVEELRKLTWDAWMIEATTHRTMKESTDLFRLGKAEIEANPDGIDFSGPFFESLILAGVMTRDGSLDPSSMEFAEGAKIYNEMLFKTPAYAVIKTPANDRLAQIEAGRRWLRLNLTTTALGLSLHPVSQALQEYPEMSDTYAKLHIMLAKPGETVQMLGRLGYGPTVPQSPRWPLEAKLMNA